MTSVSATNRFPVRRDAETTLTGLVLAWAAHVGIDFTPTSKESTFRFALELGRRELARFGVDTRDDLWRRWSKQVLTEFLEEYAADDEMPEPSRSNVRHLCRLRNDAGSKNALRLLAEALNKGAGLRPEDEDDPWRAVINYASAIWASEKAAVR